MDIDRFEGQMFFTTVRITVARDNGEGSSVGTGFLVRATIPNHPDRMAVLLVSNKHVYHNPRNPVELRFHCQNAQAPSFPDLSRHVQYTSNDFVGIYEEHPNPAIDLACLNISFMANPQHHVFWKGLPPEMFSDFSEKELLPGKQVWFVGYPANRFDVAHNLPILRVGYIASEPTVDFNAKPQFLIDAQVFPGSSGSPVIATLEKKFKLLGVLTQVMIRNQRIESIPVADAQCIELGLGLGIVYKAHLVRELIDIVIGKIKNNLESSKSEPTIQK
jgi:hypothetical protein